MITRNFSLFDQADIIKISDKKYLKSRGQLLSEFKNILTRKYKPEITNAPTIKTINKYLLNESLKCLDKNW
ncbi:hypothetical protein LCGC14_0586970 [marine sediment metagenome]|uniref:Uncharacterized protein n=1 Tax=marine sediment metagenome TaxID=412755 RepID=A0A0F9REQ9_9ZZZZ|nr:hypothetical protein [archaeon]HEC36996.1 hypothetical protein [bacterium]